MTNTNTMQKAAGATNSNGQHIDTSSSNSPTDEAINQAYDGKAIATWLTTITLAG